MRFEVETSRVGQTSRDMSQLVDNATRERKAMMDAIGAMNGMWVGEAHDDFVAQFSRDNSDMTELLRELTRISNLFDEARRAYEECESSAKELASALQI